jgi:hypothetical protein
VKVLEIPIASSAAHFVQENQIFRKSFFLEFEWIEREKFWSLHIFQEERQALSLGIKLLPNWPLYSHHEAQKPVTFMLLGKSPSSELSRHNLSEAFTLVAYL